MLTEYVIKLVDTLPCEITNVATPQIVDLVLSGGMFNGSFQVGALHFLKEMENRKYIKINRISGCSVGSIVAFLYFIDGLDMMPMLCDVINAYVRKTHTLKIIKKLKKYLGNRIHNDICKKVNGKLFIAYNNVKTQNKIIKSSYKNVDEIINAIIRSCFIPYFTDGNLLYENKYIDGITPYIFKVHPKMNSKIIYLDLFGMDKIKFLLNIKNEKTNCHRLLYGLLDIHLFFIKNCNTNMSSYVTNWTCFDIIINHTKLLIERIIIYIAYAFLLIKQNLPNECNETTQLYKLVTKIRHAIFVLILKSYYL